MDPYIGEVRMFAGNYAPLGWLMCWGQILKIADYQNLHSLLGKTYGGDGTTTFGLPDLRGRVAVGQGSGAGLSPRRMGESIGAETVVVGADETSHHHTLLASLNAGESNDCLVRVLGQVSGTNRLYRKDAAKSVALHASSVGHIGSSRAHNNMMPSLGIHFIIAYNGTFPTCG